MFEAFQLGPFLFRTYLLLLLIGAWLATELFLRLVAALGLRIVFFPGRLPWFILSFLLCGRLFGMLLVYRVYVQDPVRIFIVWDGVFSVAGGCIGIGLVLFLMVRRNRESFLRWLDAIVPPAVLLTAFDWLGRFFGALSYGKPTDAPWGIALESLAVRYTVPIHPVQLYYALWFFALTLLLLHLKRRRGGVVTLTGVVLGCIGVVLLEFFRGDFAVTVFAKLSDFAFLILIFASLGAIIVCGRGISHRSSLVTGIVVGFGTMTYLLVRPWISVASIEWRFSQFLAVLAIFATVVYVVTCRWKSSHGSHISSSGFPAP